MSRAREELIDEVLVLAAVDRAVCHRGVDEREPPGVLAAAILMHLDVRRRPGRARRVRARLVELQAAGLLQCSSRHGMLVWALTGEGRRRLSRARRAGRMPVLPEAPQHVAWREARAAAEAGVDGFSEAVGEAVLQTFFLLDALRAGQAVSSDEWFVMAEWLHRLCRRLGSASYCLGEWREPTDERADIDDRQDPGDDRLADSEWKHRQVLRSGRRNISRWHEN